MRVLLCLAGLALVAQASIFGVSRSMPSRMLLDLPRGGSTEEMAPPAEELYLPGLLAASVVGKKKVGIVALSPVHSSRYSHRM